MKRRLSWVVISALLLSVLSLVFVPDAFAGSTYSFTVAGASGRYGPTQAQVNSSYSATTLAGLVTIGPQGIQNWTVPASGKYSISIAGAGGGGNTAGKGAVLYGEFNFTQGTVLRILVGQMGTASSNYAGGGGGGSFVWDSSTATEPLIAAGGGGGDGGGNYAGVNASTTTTGNAGTYGAGGVSNSGPGAPGAGGTNGSAGTTYDASANCWDAAAGAGWKGNSTTAPQFCGIANNALSPINGGTGGASFSASGNDEGGFGGGGGGGGDANNVASVGGGGGGYSGGGNGSNDSTTDRGAGGGGGSYNAGTNTSASIASTIAHGYVTIASLGPSITTFAPRVKLTNSTTIIYDLVFSEAVTGLAIADFSKSGTGSSSCTIGTPSGSGATYTITLTGCSPGTVVLTLAANAVTNAVPQTAPASNTDAATVIIDQTAPTISSVSAPANKTYIPSETPTFTMVFSESVTVTGTPRIALTVGSLAKYANFVSMPDSKTALFRYTVATAAGEFDTDGISMSSTTLDLNGGSVADLATNALSPATFTAPTLTSVLIAQPASAPTITSITATSTQLDINFTAGASNGATITNYQYSLNGGSFTNRATGTTASPLTITGLTNGTAYAVRIRAISAAGNGDSSTAVTETPTAVSVTGDSTLVLTYGNSASTGAYSATGGTGSYTWSLGSVLTGVSLSGTTVTASSSTPAGTYTQTVRATDTNSQVGSKTLTITVNKASTSITISLPNSASNAALGGAVTITATVPRAGAVNFMLGGSTISGCGSASAASTTATCSWTPVALGSVSLTATFTPTDSSNFETSTTTTLSITVVNGVSTVTLSLTGGVTQAPKGQAINIIATIDQAGKVSFYADGKRISGCYNKLATVGNVNCSWKPAVQKQVNLTATLDPTNNVYNNSTSSLTVRVIRRSGPR